MDGARRFSRAALAVALEPGWLEVLGIPGEFAAEEVERALGSSRRGSTIDKLRVAKDAGLVDELDRKGSKGGKIRWAVTSLGVEVRTALLQLVDLTGDATAQREERPRITALMAVVDARNEQTLRRLQAGDLYAELRGAIEQLPASASVFRVKLEAAERGAERTPD